MTDGDLYNMVNEAIKLMDEERHQEARQVLVLVSYMLFRRIVRPQTVSPMKTMDG